jgi:hypothetical protein
LAGFNGLSDKTFYLHLKESEFRFNNRNNNIEIFERETSLDIRNLWAKVYQTLSRYKYIK